MKYPVSAPFLVYRDGKEIELEISGTYYPPTPDVCYLSNGDPGYPGDPAEIDAVIAKLNGAEFELTAEEQEQAETALLAKGGEGDSWPDMPDSENDFYDREDEEYRRFCEENSFGDD